MSGSTADGMTVHTNNNIINEHDCTSPDMADSSTRQFPQMTTMSHVAFPFSTTTTSPATSFCEGIILQHQHLFVVELRGFTSRLKAAGWNQDQYGTDTEQKSNIPVVTLNNKQVSQLQILQCSTSQCDAMLCCARTRVRNKTRTRTQTQETKTGESKSVRHDQGNGVTESTENNSANGINTPICLVDTACSSVLYLDQNNWMSKKSE